MMHPISALALLPQHDKALLHELSHIYMKIVEIHMGVLYLNYPVIVGNMHPENKKDFLDCISKSTKGKINKELFE